MGGRKWCLKKSVTPEEELEEHRGNTFNIPYIFDGGGYGWFEKREMN